ncbi:MAG: hypothetical protein R2790_06445 [Flavobacterium haoranii]
MELRIFMLPIVVIENERIDAQGNVTTFAGTGVGGAVDGVASVASFQSFNRYYS